MLMLMLDEDDEDEDEDFDDDDDDGGGGGDDDGDGDDGDDGEGDGVGDGDIQVFGGFLCASVAGSSVHEKWHAHILPSENHKVVRRQGGRNINLLLVPVVI